LLFHHDFVKIIVRGTLLLDFVDIDAGFVCKKKHVFS